MPTFGRFKSFFLAFACLLFFNATVFGQVSVTQGMGAEALCVDQGYSTLSNIIIVEGTQNDFTNSGNPSTLIFTIPANFEFNTASTPGVVVGGAGLSNVGISFSGTNTLTLGFNLFGTNATATNTITISGVQIRAVSGPSSGNMTSSGSGTFLMNNVTPGVTSFAVLGSSEQPVADAGSGGDVCGKDGGNPFTFTGVASVGTGTWTKTSGPGTESFGDENVATTTVTVDTYGTYVFKWEEVNGSCSDFEEVTVNFYQQPIANAGGPTGEVCGLGYALTAGQSVPGSTGLWTVTAGAPTDISFSDNTSFSPTATSAAYGVYTFQFTETNGSCSSSNSIVVTYVEPPIADGGDDGSECDLDYTFNATLSTGGSGNWAKISGPVGETYDDSTLEVATVTVVTYGTYVFRWTETNGAACIDTDDITVVFTDPPTVDAGAATDVTCGDSFSYTVSGSSATNGTILWTTSGDGGFVDATIIDPEYILGPTDMVGGAITLTMTVTGTGSCTPVNDNLVLTISPAPTADAGSDQEICEDNGAYMLPAGAASINGTIAWTENGTGSITAGATTLTPTYTPGASETGVVTLTMTVTGLAGCSATTAVDVMELTIAPSPVASFTTTDACDGSAALFDASGSSVSSGSIVKYEWDFDNNGSYEVDAGTATSASNIFAGPATYTVGLRVTTAAGCINTTTNTVTINANPTPVIAGDNLVCAVETGVVYSTANVGGNSYSWNVVGGTITGGAGTASITVDWGMGAAGSITLTETVIATGCVTTTAVYGITISPAPTADAGSDQEICEDNGAYMLPAGASSTNGTIAWTENGTGSITAGATTLTPTYTPGASETGVVTLTMTVTGLAGCSATTAVSSMLLTVTPAPTADAGLAATTCEDAAYLVSDAAVTNSGGILWTHDGNGFLTNATSTTPTYTPVALDGGTTVTLTLTVTGLGSCVAAVSTKALTITAGPIADAGSDDEICSDQPTYTVTGTTSSNGTIAWSSSSAGVFTNGTTNNPIYTINATDITNGSVTLTKTVSSAGCSDAVSSMVLTVTPAPTADAGLAASTCEDAAYLVSDAVVTNSGGILWTHDGNGFLTNATSTTPTYTPVALDGGTTVTLTLTVTGLGSCVAAVSTKALTITAGPIADAGSDDEICSDQPTYTVTGTTSSNGTIAWSSSSAGVFTNGTTDNPIYTINATDITNGSVTLTKTVSSAGCNDAVSSMVLTVTPAPTADAGLAASTCEDAAYLVSDAVVTNSGGILWTHDGNGFLTNATSTTPTYTPVALDGGTTVTLTLTVTGLGSCVAAVSTKALTITAGPIADAGSDDEICSDQPTYTVTGTTSSNGTIAWSSSSAGVFTNGTTNNPIYTINATDITNGSVTLTKTVSSAGCSDAVSSMVLTVTPAPTADAGLAASTCEDAAYLVSDAVVTNSGGILWTHDGNGFLTNATSTTPTYTPVALDGGTTVTLTLTVTGLGSCVAAVSTKALTITAGPIADAGSDDEICSDQPTYTVTGTTSSNGTIAWSSSSAGVFTNGTTNNPIYTINATDITNGSVTLTKTVSSAGCSDAVSSMVLTVTPAPTADAGLAASTCEDAAYLVSDAVVTNSGGILWTHDGNGFLTNATSTTPTYTPVALDGGTTVTLTLTVTGLGSCVAAVSTKALTITAGPIADAGSDDEICSDQPTYTVTGTTSSNGTIAWSSSSAGVFTNGTTNNPIYTINATDITNGSVTLTKTVSSAGCNDAVSSMVLTVTPAPTADAGLAASTCEDAAYLVSDAVVTNSGGILWTHDGNGFLTNATSTTPTYTPVALDGGTTVTLTLTVTGLGSCVAAVSTKALTITAGPIADAGSDDEICSDQPTYTVTGTTSSNGTIAWSSSSAGVFTNGTTNNPIYTINATDITNGSVTLTKTVSSAGCNDAVSSMVLTVTPAPTADAGLAASTCEDAAYLVSDAVVTNSGGILWTHDGNGFLTNATSTTPTYTPVALDGGTTVTLTLTVTGLGSCVAAVSTKALTITAGPIADAGSDDEICSDQPTYTVTGTTSSNGTIAWSSSSAGVFTNGTTDNPIYTINATDITNGSVTLTKTVSSAGCNDAVSSMVLTVTPAPTADAGLAASTCEDAAYLVSDAVVTNSGGILWTHDGNGFLTNATSTTPTYTPVALDGGTTVTLTLTVTGLGSCVAAVSTKALTITAGPIADAGSDDEICSDQPTYTVTGTTSSNGTIAWSSSSAGVFTNGTTDNPIYTINATDITNGSVTLTKTVSSAGCSDAVSSMVLTVTPAPTADAGLPIAICTDAGYTVMDASATNGSILWTDDGNGFLTDPTTLNPTYTPVAADAGNIVTLTLTVTGGGSCTSAIATKALNVTPGPTSDAGPNEEVCADQATFTLTGSPVSTGSVVWTSSSGGTFVDPALDNPTYNINATDITNGTVTLTKTASTAGCSDAVSIMVLTLTPAPIANAGAPVSICTDAGYTVSDASSLNGSILWTHNGSGFLTNSTTITPTYTPVMADAGMIVTLTLTVAGNGTCIDNISTKDLTVTTGPTSDAGSDDATCSDLGTYTVVGSAIDVGDILWTSSSIGTFVDPTVDNPVYNIHPNDVTAGTVTLTKTSSSAGCSDVFSSMILTITPAATADAGAPISICTDAGYTVIDASSTNGSILWTHDGTGFLTDATTINPTYTPIATDAGNTVILTLTVTASGSCPDAIDTKDISVTTGPTANAGPDEETCADQPTFALSGSPVSVGDIIWTSSSGGTFVDSTIDNPTYNINATDVANGTVTLTKTASSAGCSDVFSNMVLTIYEVPIADAGTGGNVCGLSYIFNGLKSVSGSTGSWSIDSQPGGSGVIYGDINSPASTVTVDTYGSYTFRWTEVNGVCSDSETVVISFQPQPSVNAGTGGSICGIGVGSPFTFTGSASGIGIGFWTNETPGVGNETFSDVLSPTSDVTVDAYGTYVFRYTEISGACSDFDEVTVIFKEIPVASAADEIICSGDVTNVLITNPNVIPGTTFSWVVNSVTNVTGASAGTGNLIGQVLVVSDGFTSGSVTYEITPFGNDCVGSPILTTVTVNPVPTALVMPLAETICDGETTNLTLTNPNGVTGTLYTWTVVSTGVSGGLPNATPAPGPIADALSLDVGNVQGSVTYTVTPVSPDNCQGAPVNVIVTIDPIPDALASDATICSGELTNIAITNPNAVPGTNYSWTATAVNVSGASDGSGSTISQLLTSITGNTQGSVDYLITPSANGCDGTPITITVTVDPKPNALVTPLAETICDGEMTNLALMNPNGVTGTQYIWSVASSGVSGATANATPASGPITDVLTLDAVNVQGSVTYTVTPVSPDNCQGNPVDVIVTVNPIPDVLASDVSICSNETTNILITNPNGVSGTSYSWTVSSSNVNGASDGTGSVISQQLTTSIGNAQGTVDYTITPSANGCDGIPLVITVTVNPIPDAAVTPLAQTICDGDMTNLALNNPNGVAGTLYTWVASESGVSGAVDNSVAAAGPISDALSLDVANVQGSVTYTVTPVSPDNCLGTPVNVIVTVNPVPDVSASNETICSGETTNIVLNNPNMVGGTSYSWTVASSNVNGASSGAGSVISQQLTTVTSNTVGTVDYTITPSASGCDGTPIVIRVTVNPIPNVLVTPLAETVCNGDMTNLTLTNPNGVSGTLYTWVATQSGVNGALDNAIPSAGPIADLLNLDVANVQGSVTYSVTPVSPDNCLGAPIDVIVTVEPIPDVFASDETICSGETTNVLISNPNGVSGTTYDWTVVSTNVNGATAGSGSVISQLLTTTGNTQGTADYTITPSANGCSGTPIVVTVTVDPIPDVLASPAGESICNGETTSITLTNPNSIPGTNYSWTVVSSAGLSGATPDVGSVIAQTIFNPGNTPGLVTYTVTPSAGGCSGVPINVNVVVNPTPTLATSGDEVVCSGESTNIVFSNPNGVAGTTYSWIVLSSVNVSGAMTGVGNFIAQPLSSADGINIGSVTYQVTAFTGSCLGETTTVNVDVNPDVIVDAGGDQVVCEGTPLNLGGSISGGTTNGTWTTAGDGIFDDSGNGTGIFGASSQYIPGSSDIAAGTVTITLTADDPDGSGPCSVRTDQFVLTINPIALVTVPADYLVCEPNSILLSGTIGGGAVLGVWSVTSGNGVLTASSITGNVVTADYIPDVSDVNTNIIMRLMAIDPDGPVGPCTNIFDEVVITIEESAKVSAGVDLEICEDAVANLSGTVNGSVSTGSWSIVGGSGDGTFGNANVLNTTYTPGPNDKLTGALVTLRLTTADPGTTCGPVFEDMEVLVNKLPEVFITGLNPEYQEDAPPVQLQGFPVSGGTGFFSGPGVSGDEFFPNLANLTPTINTIVYTYTNSATGCTNSDTYDVIINPITNIDFQVAGAVVNALGQPEICSNDGLIELLGQPDHSLGSPVTEYTSTTINSNIVLAGGDYFINTDGLASGLYDVTYTFTNSLGAISSRTRFIKVYPGPLPDFTVNNFCIEDPIGFTDESILPPSGFGGTIVAWEWNFGDNSVSFNQNPFHIYGAAGTYNVELRVFSDRGCSNVISKTITVGPIPNAMFTAAAVCNNDETIFVDESTYDAATSTIISYFWDFGDGGTSTLQNPTHQYIEFKVYDVSLTITTDKLCSDTRVIPLAIFPYTTVTVTDEYQEGFENLGASGWQSGGTQISDTSWLEGPPTGTIINSASEGVNAWWTGANGGNYYNSEQSFVDAPCFDIRQLTRPMISLDTWINAQEGFDGSLLQYSIDGGLNWVNLGELNKGVNWYNTAGIISDPGGDQIGWSGNSDGWINSKYNLDQIPAISRGQVRFRVAFGSNEDNPINEELNGFAFDNVSIRNRDRLVLVENFTSQSNSGYDQVKNRMLNYSNELPTDFIYLNYHVPEPGTDQLYQDNPGEPQVRANSYGISQTIKSVVDGNVYLGEALGWSIDSVDSRSLTDPQFDVDVSILPSSGNELIVTWDVTANEMVNNPIIVHTVVIEEKVVLGPGDTAYNVVKKLLPNPAGSTSQLTQFNPGDQHTSSQIPWTIDVPIYDSADLAVVVFVQEKTDGGKPGEIYQAAYLKVNDKKWSPIVTGIDEVLTGIANSIEIYPNPVQRDLYFITNNSISERFNWKIIDQRGVELAADDFRFVNGEFIYDTSEIPNGIYYLIIGLEDKPLSYEKLIIMHR